MATALGDELGKEAAMEEDLEWDEPVQSVQELVENEGVREVPAAYIRTPRERPRGWCNGSWRRRGGGDGEGGNMARIPVIDFGGLREAHEGGGGGGERGDLGMREVAMACQEWGAFQLVNHGISRGLLARVRRVAAEFFQLPAAEKQAYANSPTSLTGYGSRMGSSRRGPLDWGDYFLHYVWPPHHRAVDDIWPANPPSYRETMDEYSKEIHKLYKALMGVFSKSLGLKSSYLEEAFGEGANLVLRINYYPPCPQPYLTLGLGSHSDAGGMTFLLQDEVPGLQVKKGDRWMLVKPIADAILVNIADQLQILSNGKYKSVEHRAIVNKQKARMTIAIFCNPADDTIISPAPTLLDPDHPPLYRPMTFGEFLASFFQKGLDGKGYVESFKTNSH